MKQLFLQIQGCRQHNLKNISLKVPKNQIIVMTGVSGSGKSSLAFDTLFAEGQRRYLEYLSPQARSLIKQMPKPAVDLVEGLSPTLAIGQGKHGLYPRGIIATYTDIYDFLALLYVNIGEQHSPTTGKRLIRYTRQEIVDILLKEYSTGRRLQLLAPVKLQREIPQDAIKRLQQMGFVRFHLNNQEWLSEEPLPDFTPSTQIDVVVDRLEIKEGIRDRLSHSIETAMDLSQGILKVQEGRDGSIHYLTEIYICPETGLSFAPLVPADFNFNSPHGACPVCQGRGGQDKVNPSLLFWDPDVSLSEQVHLILDFFPKKLALSLSAMWEALLEIKGYSEEKLIKEIPADFLDQVLYGFSQELTIAVSIDENKQLIKTTWKGLIPLIDTALADRKTKGNLSELSSVKWQVCPACQGGRLKPESLACLIKGKGIHQLCAMTISALIKEIGQWAFQDKQAAIAKEILPHIQTRLQFLEEVGLGYLELNRQGKTLSDGEIQRIQLASQIGAKLSGVLYILDEPSLGLHRQDIQHLHKVIQELKALDNSIILIEHERSLIQQADQIVELGPGAGLHGGQVTFQGTYDQLLKNPTSLTGKWLSGRLTFPKPPKRKTHRSKLSVYKAALHNLNDFSVQIPLGCLVGFCGVSGSGKSTLAIDIIGEEIQKELNSSYSSSLINGQQTIKRLVLTQKQNERFSSRSIPATYIDIMTPLRQLFAETRLAKARGYTSARFSLNKRGGRCEACEGLGQIRVSMQWMPDIFVPCEVCNGLRYNYETLQVTWENRNIADVLALSVEKGCEAFQHIPSIAPKLELMKELGLEYLTLGQSFNTLSAGEVQRLRLVADLTLKSLEPTLYILDEPSAGLHFHDIEKLIKILHRLVERGHSVFVIEHHLDILRQADWLIELGPGGGPQGGQLVFEGTVDKILKADTPTSRVLRL
jgi:excinuclease ABC subunit A